jgi:hypothetical protein
VTLISVLVLTPFVAVILIFLFDRPLFEFIQGAGARARGEEQSVCPLPDGEDDGVPKSGEAPRSGSKRAGLRAGRRGALKDAWLKGWSYVDRASWGR